MSQQTFYPNTYQTGQTGCWIQHLSLHRQFDGPTASRSLCDTLYQVTVPLLKLEARSGGGRNRCFHAGLVECPRICSSSMVSNLEGVGKGTDGEGNSGVDYPTVTNQSLVPYLNRNDSRLLHHSSKAEDSGPLTKAHGDGSISSSSVGHLEGLRQGLGSEEISGKAIDLIISSWRDKTNSNYDSAWRSCNLYCRAHSLCSFSTTFTPCTRFPSRKVPCGSGI